MIVIPWIMPVGQKQPWSRTHSRASSRPVTATILQEYPGRGHRGPSNPPESRDNSATTNCRAVQTNAYYPRFGEQFWILCGASFRWPLVLTLFLQSSLFLWDRRRLNLLEEEIFQGLFVSFDLEFNKFWNIYGRGTWRYKNRGNLIIGGSSKRSLWN